MKRRTIPVRILAAENAAITQFLFDRAYPAETAQLSMQAVFEADKSWRDENKMPGSELTIDGFGRLFPHEPYPRRSAMWEPAGHALKCVFGMALR